MLLSFFVDTKVDLLSKVTKLFPRLDVRIVSVCFKNSLGHFKFKATGRLGDFGNIVTLEIGLRWNCPPPANLKNDTVGRV